MIFHNLIYGHYKYLKTNPPHRLEPLVERMHCHREPHERGTGMCKSMKAPKNIVNLTYDNTSALNKHESSCYS